MRRLLPVLLSTILVGLSVLPVFAAGSYSAEVTVTDTSSTARTGVSAFVPTDIDNYIDMGYMGDDGLDTRVLEGTTEVPYMITDDAVAVMVASLAADQERTYDFQTGYTPENTSFDVVVSDGGVITRWDDGDFEPGDDFLFELEDVFVDTSAGSGKYLIHKQATFSLYVSDDEEITASIDDGRFNFSQNLDWSIHGASPFYYAGAETFTSFPAVTVDSVSFYLKKVGNPTGSFYVRMWDVSPSAVIGTFATVDATTLTTSYQWYTFDTTPVTNPSVQDIRLGIYYLGGDGSNYIVMGYAGSGDYITDGIASYLATSTWYNMASSADFTMVASWSQVKVVATGVTTGFHDIDVEADGSDFTIDVDGVEEDSTSLAGASCPDYASDWYLLDNRTVNFATSMSYYKHTVSDTLIGWYEPNALVAHTSESGTADSGSTTTLVDSILTQADNYWNGACLVITETTDHNPPEGEVAYVTDFVASSDTLYFGPLTAAVGAGDLYTVDFLTVVDRQGASEDGVMYFTANVDLDVSIGSMLSITEYVAGGVEGSEPPTVLPLPTDDLFPPTEDPSEDLPYYDLVDPAAYELGWETRNLYGILSIFVGVGLGVGAMIATGSVLLAAIAVCIGLSVGVAQGTIGLWVVIVYIIFAGGYLVTTRSV